MPKNAPMLDDGKKDQIRNMFKEGKSIKEVREFFKSQYQMNLWEGRY